MADIVNPGTTASGILNKDALPKNYDLAIYQGDYVDILVTVTDNLGAPVNLTGFTAKAQLKESYEASTSVEFTCTLTDAAAGQVRIYLPSTLSSTLAAGSYIWDFQIVNASADARTYLTGDVVVSPEVTK